jgi:hypothetical protein
LKTSISSGETPEEFFSRVNLDERRRKALECIKEGGGNSPVIKEEVNWGIYLETDNAARRGLGCGG